MNIDERIKIQNQARDLHSKGYTYKQIGEIIGASRETARKYVNGFYSKRIDGLKSRFEVGEICELTADEIRILGRNGYGKIEDARTLTKEQLLTLDYCGEIKSTHILDVLSKIE